MADRVEDVLVFPNLESDIVIRRRCLDGTARVWDGATGKELFVLTGHTGSVLQADWNSSEDRILTASGDNTARAWDAESGMGLFLISAFQDESRILTASREARRECGIPRAGGSSSLCPVTRVL